MFIAGSILFTGKPSESQFYGNPIVHNKFNVAVHLDCRTTFDRPTEQWRRNLLTDETTYKQVSSYIKRELRSWTDVDIALDNEEPTHGILIETINRGIQGEMIIVITFVEYINREKYFAAYLPEKTVKQIVEKEMNDGPGWLIYHSIWKGTNIMHHNTKTGDLSKLCKQIIVDFDTNVLEEARQRRN